MKQMVKPHGQLKIHVVIYNKRYHTYLAVNNKGPDLTARMCRLAHTFFCICLKLSLISVEILKGSHMFI